ncbi:MAG TPA: O-antigen ligase family protein [Candidatus Binatia bacterium]|nr:O-antigen ligase family protein [Candidatus Binatia bacterium]
MNSRIGIVASKLTESGWLASLVIVPILFNTHSARTFEEDKIPLFRSIAVLVLVGLIVRGIESGRDGWTINDRPLWRVPLVTIAASLAVAYVLATVCSIEPLTSLVGSYQRTQGTYTWLSYTTIFFALVMLVRQRSQRELIIATIILASVPVAAYAVAQHFGGDPIRWATNLRARATGTTGNAIFLGGYLIMVLPLTSARFIEQLNRGRRQRWTHSSTVVLLGTHGLVLALQVIALLYSNSRGPLIGLAVGLTFFAALIARQRGPNWLSAFILSLAIGGGLVLLILSVARDPLRLHNVPYVSQVAALVNADSGTGKVRTIIWGGTANLLADSPASRRLIGYGPETFFTAFLPYYPPLLSHYEDFRVGADRAHNETFDALATIGLVGCGVELALFVACFLTVLAQAGVCASNEQRRELLAVIAVGALLGAVLPYAIERSVRFCGLGVPIGIIAALAFYLLKTLSSRADSDRRLDQPLPLALFAAIVGHFVEIQFGIAVSLTRLLFWVYVALVVVQPHGESSAEEPPVALETRPLALIVSLIWIVLAFGFYRPGFSASKHVAVLPMFIAPWLFGGVVALAPDAPPSRWRRVGSYIVWSVVPWLVFLAAYVWWFAWRPPLHFSREGQVVAGAQHMSHVISFVYAAVGVAIALLTAVSVRFRGDSTVTVRTPWRRLLAYAALTCATVPIIVWTNLNLSRADIVSKQVDSYLHSDRPTDARIAAEKALELQPTSERYATSLGSILMDLARTAPANSRRGYLTQAQLALQLADQRSPLNVDNPRNLARLHHLWATLEDDPAERTRHFEEAERYHERTTHLSPQNASLWNEWALLCIQRQQTDRALELLDHSLAIDDLYPTTNWIRAGLYMSRGNYEAALADYNRALQFRPQILALWSGKALALTRLKRFDEAIIASRAALEIDPDDLISHRNLALLYQETGQLEQALEEAQAALDVAAPPDDDPLKAFIDQLEKQLAMRQ